MFAERPQYILLPVRIGTIVLSLLAALLLDFLPWKDVALVPDFVALTLTFWCVRQPRLVGLGVGWLLGLLMDTGNGVLLGQHALAYSLLAFAAITLSRRILWFPLWQQATHVFLLLFMTQFLMLAVRMASGASFPGVLYFLGSVIAAALWPIANVVLLAPQRRPQNVDENRPL